MIDLTLLLLGLVVGGVIVPMTTKLLSNSLHGDATELRSVDLSLSALSWCAIVAWVGMTIWVLH